MKLRFMIDYPHDNLQIVTIELPDTVLQLEQATLESFRESTKKSLQQLFDLQGGYVQAEPEWTFENCNDEYPEDFNEEVDDE